METDNGATNRVNPISDDWPAIRCGAAEGGSLIALGLESS